MSLILFMLFMGPPTLPQDPPSSGEDIVAPVSSPTERARALYQEGTVFFESADYAQAIQKFTEALQFVEDRSVRLALIYNIARAHEKAYEIDRDPTHLRQAKSLYTRYQKDVGDMADELDADSRLLMVEHQLDELDVPEGPSKDSEVVPSVSVSKLRSTGIGMVVPGSAALVGGVILVAVGSRFEPNAEAQVNQLHDLGIDPDHPAWNEGDQFIAQERQKGAVMMGVGVGVAVVGAVLVGFGVPKLAKARKIKMESRVGGLALRF